MREEKGRLDTEAPTPHRANGRLISPSKPVNLLFFRDIRSGNRNKYLLAKII